MKLFGTKNLTNGMINIYDAMPRLFKVWAVFIGTYMGVSWLAQDIGWVAGKFF